MKIFEQFKGRRVFIYGAGVYGKWIFGELNKHNISVKGFFDINAQAIQPSFHNISVCRADEYTGDKEGVVIAAIVKPYAERHKIFKFIYACGFKEIVDAQSLRCHSVDYEKDIPETEVLSGLELFKEQHSRDIYTSNVLAHLYRNYSDCLESIGSVQYFPDDIPIDYDRVIDCGGYTGDTAVQFITQKDPQEIVIFEPDMDCVMKMSRNLNVFGFPGLYLFPCAVSDKTSERIVAIDDVLKHFVPTLIKMDIEGDELKALKGAEDTIKRYRPSLAICVYHRINHIWDIPLLLNSWNLGYKFYLKCHNSYTMETVLYATT